MATGPKRLDQLTRRTIPITGESLIGVREEGNAPMEKASPLLLPISTSTQAALDALQEEIDVIVTTPGPPGPAGPAGSAPEISATYAAINVSTEVRFIYVAADETNNGDSSLYLHNGTSLKFLQTIA